MKKVFRANLYFLIILLISTFAPRLLAIIYRSLNIQDVRIVLLLNHCILFLVPAIIYVLITKVSVRKTFRLNPISIKNILMVILLAVVIQPVVILFSLISSIFFPNEIGQFIGSIMDTPYLLLVLLIAGMPAITEEVTLRGVVLSGYDFKNKWTASIVTGILFGIFHLNSQQFLYAAVLGFVLAYLVRVTNSIFASMIMHFMINGLQITIQKVAALFMDTSNIDPNAVANFSMNQKIQALSIYGFLAVVFGAASIILIKKIEDNCKARGIYDSYERMNLNNNHSYARVNLDSNTYSEVAKERVLEEKVVNVPLILTIIGYLIIMNYPIIIELFLKIVTFRR